MGPQVKCPLCGSTSHPPIPMQGVIDNLRYMTERGILQARKEYPELAAQMIGIIAAFDVCTQAAADALEGICTVCTAKRTGPKRFQWLLDRMDVKLEVGPPPRKPEEPGPTQPKGDA